MQRVCRHEDNSCNNFGFTSLLTELSADYCNHYVATMLSEITSKSVEPNNSHSSDTTTTITASQINEINNMHIVTTSSAYLLIDTVSFLMTTNIVTNDEETANSALSISGDASRSSIFYNVITSIENTAVLYMTMDGDRRGSTTILPATTKFLSTIHIDDITILPTITKILSTIEDSGNVVMATGVPSEKSSSTPPSIGAIIGMTVGVIILIAVVITSGVVVLCLVRRKRIKRKYDVNWIQHEQAGDCVVAA